jgi:hypothetical protein
MSDDPMEAARRLVEARQEFAAALQHLSDLNGMERVRAAQMAMESAYDEIMQHAATMTQEQTTEMFRLIRESWK